jgi:hypothetical protein
MNTGSEESPPLRKRQLLRWLAVLIAALLAYFGWKAYDYRAAIKEARALGWTVGYTDPIDVIQKDWVAAFQKETWRGGLTGVIVPACGRVEPHRKLLLRLNPRVLSIFHAEELRDLAMLEGLSHLQKLTINNATNLTNVDALKNHRALDHIAILGSSRLTNLDALKHLPALEKLWLNNCTAVKNLDMLEGLTALNQVLLPDCTGLTSLDGLKNLPALTELNLEGCTSLTHAVALKSLTTLKAVSLRGCTGISKEAISALKAALPSTEIYAP